MNVLVFKLGHDENNLLHVTGNELFYPVINNSNKDSKYYNSENRYLSEYSTINTIIDNIYKYKSKYTHLGICTYRTLIGDIPQNNDYKSSLELSKEIILNSLNNHDGIISTKFNTYFNNKISRARWTGTKSLEYLHLAIDRVISHQLSEKFIDYLNGDDNSFRTVCVLPIKYFEECFYMTYKLGMELLEIRRNDNTLIDRSVGYELETFTSFYLTSMLNELNIDRIKHTII